MTLEQADLRYFARGKEENPRFWSRFGGQPTMAGSSVLDVGCGHGSLCIYTAQAGAAKVVGLDLNGPLIEFANTNLTLNYPQHQEIVSFHHMDLKEYPDETFDILVSKDTFEHIIDLPGMLAEMKRRLKPGGRIYAGFGPLYNSPYGDHGTAKSRIPWAHLVMGDDELVRRVDTRWTKKVSSIHDLGLNRLAYSDYVRILNESELKIVYFQTNCSDKYSSKVLSLLRKIPGFEEYFTHNIYCILEKVST